MQGLTREGLDRFDHGRACRRRDAEAPAVGLVTDQGEADVGHVHANLVGTAGFELDPHVSVRPETLEHTVVADCWLATVCDSHALAHAAVATDGGVDLATGSDHAHHDAFVDTADRALLQLVHQVGLRLQGLGHDHQTGGVLVQAVDDAGTWHVDDVGHVMQQGVEQGTAGMAGSRVHHQARRLVDDQDLIVFIDDVQRNVLGLPFALGFLLGFQGQHGTAMHGVTRAQDSTVDRQTAIFDPGRQPRARILVEQLGGDLVEALTAQFGRDLCAKLNDLGHARFSGRTAFGFSCELVVKYGFFCPGVGRGAHHNRTAPPKTAAVKGTQAAMQVKHLLLIAILGLTAACSSNKEVIDENLSEAELYQQAQADLDNSSYTSAVNKLKALESRYPFGRYADQAQLELIYANYKNSEPEAAKSAAERFIRLHPQHPNVDYAYYLKGLTSFDQDRGLLARFLPLDMTKRDPGAARDSYNEFAQLTSRFPNSRYAPDAKQRMIYLRNLLASYEIHVADYYLSRQAYVAAANRGRYVVENFQETPSVGDGLAVMVEAYQKMHLDDLAATSLETLKLNYPDHPSLADGEFQPKQTESDGRGWLSKATLGLIETDTPLPPGQTRANQDVIKQFQDARDEMPKELLPKDENGDPIEPPGPKEADSNRSWFSYMTFGLFD